MISGCYGKIRQNTQSENLEKPYQALNVKISKINCNLEYQSCLKTKRSSNRNRQIICDTRDES